MPGIFRDDEWSYLVINEETIQFKYNGNASLHDTNAWTEGVLGYPGDLIRIGGATSAIEGDTESISKLGFVQESGLMSDDDLPPGVDPEMSYQYHIVAPAMVIKQ